MRLEDMKYFVEIAKAKSINRASKVLFMSQPALSRIITSLENELGLSLLNRSNHGIELTQYGQKVYDDCVDILEHYNNCIRQWNDMAYKAKNNMTPITIPIVALPMVCNNTLNQVFYEVAQKYPRIRLELYEKQLFDILETIIQYPNAIGISRYNEKTKDEVYHFAKQNNMQLLPLFDDEDQLYASYNCALSGRQLTSNDLKQCILASYFDPKTENMPQLIDAGLSGAIFDKFKQVIRLSNRYAVSELTAANQAVMLSAVRMQQDDTFRKSGKLVSLKVTDFHLPMTFYILASIEPTIEEKIVIDTLFNLYRKLNAFPLT